MTRDQFKILHSEIMMYFQCIEFDLKRIYAGMSSEDFDDEMDWLETSNFGNTLRELKKLDRSDGDPWLSDSEYDQLDRIREVRNYWAHQCYFSARCFQPRKESSKSNISKHEKRPPTRRKRSLLILE